MHVMNMHVLDQGDGSWPGSFEIYDVELEIVSGDSGKKSVACSPSLLLLQAFQ